MYDVYVNNGRLFEKCLHLQRCWFVTHVYSWRKRCKRSKFKSGWISTDFKEDTFFIYVPFDQIWLKCCRYGVKPYSFNQSINLPKFVCPNGTWVSLTEGVLILLWRYAYLLHFYDMIWYGIRMLWYAISMPCYEISKMIWYGMLSYSIVCSISSV